MNFTVVILENEEVVSTMIHRFIKVIRLTVSKISKIASTFNEAFLPLAKVQDTYYVQFYNFYSVFPKHYEKHVSKCYKMKDW
jgi:hypothetical protein